MNKIPNFLCLSLLLLSAIALGMDNPQKSLVAQLWSAALSSKNINEVRRLIAKGADVNTHDAEGRPLLIEIMVVRNTKEIGEVLIDNGANINARDHEGQTALIVAAI